MFCITRVLTLLLILLIASLPYCFASEPQEFVNSKFQYKISLPEGWNYKIWDYRTPPVLDGHLIDISTSKKMTLSIEAIPVTKESFEQIWNRMIKPEKNLSVDYGKIAIARTTANWATSLQPLLKFYCLSYLIPGKDFNYLIVIMGWNYDTYNEDRKIYESIINGIELLPKTID